MTKGSVMLFVGALALASAGLVNATPFDYCASGFNGPGVASLPTQTLSAFLTNGCISGEHQKGVNSPTNSDGYFDESLGGDSLAKVEQSILFAQGLTVTLTSISPTVSGAGSSGTWSSSQAANYLTIKAANGYALYYLGAGGATSGTWTTAGLLNNGGKQPDISHLTLWRTAVPEPKMTLVLGSMIGLLLLVVRRRRLIA
jgi:hypothetical protein